MNPSARSTALRRALSAFRAEERAAISIETAVVVPFLAFIYLQTFTYFDAFRQQALLTKAGYTVGDLLSRQVDPINEDDIEGLQDVFAYITGSDDQSWMRVSELTNDEVDGYTVNWSYATGNNILLQDTYIPRIVAELPDIETSERVVIVESQTPYRPTFNVGLPNRVINTFTSTRMRFGTGQLKFVSKFAPPPTDPSIGSNPDD